MASLDQGGVFAANPDLADPLGLQIGDSLFFRQAFGNDISLRLAAVVPRIPGLYYGYADESFGHNAYVDLDSLGPSANLSRAEHTRFLIRLTPGADSEQVANAVLTSLGPYASARTVDQGLREALADPFANVFFGFLLSQGELALGILVVAIGLFVFSASAGRKEELATFVARGVRTRTVAALIMTEGWVVTILGILLGLFAALVTVWTVLEILFLVNPTPTSVPLVIPITILLPLGLVVLGVFAAGWVGTVAIRRMDVVRVLKLRSG
jgi:predicted lysophospholipase L1 biosynthesis ABC-type transport system permease subunit